MTRLTIEVTPRVHALLVQRMRSGFYGRTVEEAAERILCQWFEDQRMQVLQALPCPADANGVHFPGCGCDLG